MFFLRLEFWPYSVIHLEDFELLLFLFLNLKCYVKIEFVVLCIACFQCDCRCIVVDFLKIARSQGLNSVDVDTRSKKLLDALLSIIVDEFYAQPEEKDRSDELIAKKTKIVLLCFVFWILAMAMTFFFSTRVENSIR